MSTAITTIIEKKGRLLTDGLRFVVTFGVL